jgi:hypothetical protein
MRPALILLVLLPFFLAACGGVGDTTVGDPPASERITDVSDIENEQVRTIVTRWDEVARQEMQRLAVKPETIEQRYYRSTASLEDIAAFYEQLSTNQGWTKVRGLPEVQNGVLLTGYEKGGGVVSLTVGAIDTTQLGGEGVVIYTAQGSK